MKIKLFGRYRIDVSQETPTLENVGTVHVLSGFVSRSTMHFDKPVTRVFKETPPPLKIKNELKPIFMKNDMQMVKVHEVFNNSIWSRKCKLKAQ